MYEDDDNEVTFEPSGKHKGAFGLGGGKSAVQETDEDLLAHAWTAGGGGWYGGGGAGNWNGLRPGGGGSGYIGSSHIIHNGIRYDNTSIAGQRLGHGKAKITRISD